MERGGERGAEVGTRGGTQHEGSSFPERTNGKIEKRARASRVCLCGMRDTSSWRARA